MSFTTTVIAPVTVQQAGVKIATRQALNFVSGATVTDDPANNSADIVIASINPPEIVTTNSSIGITQSYTIVNASGPTTQTLPLIASVTFQTFVIYNYSNFLTTIAASGSDEINGSPTALLPRAQQGITLLPTSLGWLVI